MCAGFQAGQGSGHHLVNRTNTAVLYLKVGDRTEGDRVSYPDDDLQASLEGRSCCFRHRDGSPYETRLLLSEPACSKPPQVGGTIKGVVEQQRLFVT